RGGGRCTPGLSSAEDVMTRHFSIAVRSSNIPHRTDLLAGRSAGKDVMNYGRLVAAALAGTVVDAVYGFLVYGMLLAGQFGRYPNVYRPPDASPVFLMCMFCGIFVAMLAAVAIYSKGIESKGGAAEGMRFGALLGVFL